FLILTASRSNEVLRATWGEIDLARKLWTIPAQRMKKSREHIVPLSSAAIALLQSVKGDRTVRADERIWRVTHSALSDCLTKMDRRDVTAHGFRSTFRNWCGATHVPRELAELCLSHRIGDATEQAYARDAQVLARARVMENWARRVNSPDDAGDNVVV